MLVGTPSRFVVGDRLILRFRLRPNEPENVVTGTIVRIGQEAPNRDHWCHRLVAVQFDAPTPELEHLFADLAPTQAHLFS